MNTGKYIKDTRTILGYTKKYISNVTNIDYKRYKNIEKNKVEPSNMELYFIAKALEITPQKLGVPFNYSVQKEYIKNFKTDKNCSLKSFYGSNYIFEDHILYTSKKNFSSFGLINFIYIVPFLFSVIYTIFNLFRDLFIHVEPVTSINTIFYNFTTTVFYPVLSTAMICMGAYFFVSLFDTFSYKYRHKKISLYLYIFTILTSYTFLITTNLLILYKYSNLKDENNTTLPFHVYVYIAILFLVIVSHIFMIIERIKIYRSKYR